MFNKSCIVIAEVAQAHDGSLGMAHAFIDAIADANADAVKFQTHIAQAESTPYEKWRIKFSLQDKTRYDYWKRMEFTEEQWQGLKQHAEDRGLLFISSPFSMEAVELLNRIGVSALKIASGELTNYPLLQKMSETGLPIIISTGMSTIEEIDKAVALIRSKKVPFSVLQCTSIYPSTPETIGLNMIPFFKKRYSCPVGLSDHSGTIYPALAAIAMGADIIEVHVTFHKKMFGPDVAVSVTFEELEKLVEGVRYVKKILSSPVDKDRMAKHLVDMRALFTKSIVARRDLPSGTILQEDDLAIKKPGTGIPPDRLQELIGRRLKRALEKDEIIREEDIE